MHVALIADTAWLDEELPALRNLVVGLLDEQVRVAQVVPAELAGDEISGFGEQVIYHQSRYAPINRYRLGRLADKLGELNIDLIHALDGRLWAGGAALARKLDVPAVFSIVSERDLTRVNRLPRAINLQRAAFLAATGPLADAARERLGEEALIAAAPPGVHLSNEPQRPAREADRPVSAVISGNGILDADYRAILRCIEILIAEQPQMQFFFDGQGGDQHRLWREAEKRGLLANVSWIPRRLERREILLRCDVLVHPQALGRARSLTLAAMAHRLPVIARRDPWLDYLIEDQTAWVLDEGDAEDWAAALRRLSEEPAAGEALGRRAQAWVRQNRLASSRVAATLDLYRRLTGETLPFPGG